MRLTHVLELAREIQSDAVRGEAATLYPLLKQINERFLLEEKILLDEFEDQIPQLDTYIRAMSVGIAESQPGRAPLVALEMFGPGHTQHPTKRHENGGGMAQGRSTMWIAHPPPYP